MVLHGCNCSGLSSFMRMHTIKYKHCCGNNYGFGSIFSGYYGGYNGYGMGYGCGLNGWGGFLGGIGAGLAFLGVQWLADGIGNWCNGKTWSGNERTDKDEDVVGSGDKKGDAASKDKENTDYTDLVNIQTEVTTLLQKEIGTATQEDIEVLKEKLNAEKKALDGVQDADDKKMIDNLIKNLDDLAADNEAIKEYKEKALGYDAAVKAKETAETAKAAAEKALQEIAGKSAEDIQALEAKLAEETEKLEKAVKELADLKIQLQASISVGDSVRLAYANGHAIKNEEDLNNISMPELDKFTEFDALMVLGMLGYLQKDRTSAHSDDKANTSSTNGFICGKLTNNPKVLKLLEKAQVSTEFYAGSSEKKDNWLVGYPTNIRVEDNGTLKSYDINCNLAGENGFKQNYTVTLNSNGTYTLKLNSDTHKLTRNNSEVDSVTLTYNKEKNIYESSGFKVVAK